MTPPDTNRHWARKTLFIMLSVFAVVLGVNGIMIWLAITSSNGVVSPKAYEEGLAYNATISAHEAQRQLGWKVVRVQTDFPNALTYTLTDVNQQPLTTATVQATLQRPLADATPTTLTLPETTPGTYAVPTPWPAKGQWDVNLTITHNGHTWVGTERVVVR